MSQITKQQKKLIKIYKKKPSLYGEADVMYAKMIRKIYKKKKKEMAVTKENYTGIIMIYLEIIKPKY